MLVTWWRYAGDVVEICWWCGGDMLVMWRRYAGDVAEICW